MNANISFDCQGPKDNKGEKPDKKYFDFLSRNHENYDKIKIYFDDNYNNDLNEYQKEYYLKHLDLQYYQAATRIERILKNEKLYS